MLLYHYSNEDIKNGFIKPELFGSNAHTPKQTGVNRSYYYIDPDYREKFFLGARYRYIIEIKDILEAYIYDLSTDDLNIIEGGCIADNLIKLRDNLGYIGVKYKSHTGNEIVALFYKMKYIKKEVL